MTSRLAPLQIVTEAAPAAATWAEAKRLVAEIRAGGRAWLESEQGGGCRAFIVLPNKAPDVLNGAASAAA